jgi:hypothetical protein
MEHGPCEKHGNMRKTKNELSLIESLPQSKNTIVENSLVAYCM